MELSVDGEVVERVATSAGLDRAIDELAAGRKEFLCLDGGPCALLQAAGAGNGSLAIEYRERAGQPIMQAKPDPAVGAARGVLQAYLRGDGSWRGGATWEEMAAPGSSAVRTWLIAGGVVVIFGLIVALKALGLV